MTAEPPRSPADCVSSDLSPAADDDDDRRHPCRPAAVSPVNGDVDPWRLPQLTDDDSPHWHGMFTML